MLSSARLIDGYAEELAKSLLNIAHIMRQEKQAGRADITSEQKKDEDTNTEQEDAKKPEVKQVETQSGFMGIERLCKQFSVPDENKQAFRKRLERFRKKNTLNSNAFTESQNKGIQQSKYLYNVAMVADIAEQVKGRRASLKRPSGKKAKNI